MRKYNKFGKKEGFWKENFPSLREYNRWMQGCYENGLQEGIWKYHHENGEFYAHTIKKMTLHGIDFGIEYE